MSAGAAPYDLAQKLCAMGLSVLLEPVRSNTESSIETTKGRFCLYRGGAVLSVTGQDGKPCLRIGHPWSRTPWNLAALKSYAFRPASRDRPQTLTSSGGG
jgi:hypothetical protein